jgi:hypothetical protein
LGNCTDFKEEESMLQSIGTALGVSIDWTPKCHCELAGEGIEYSYGCAKNIYQLIPLSIKGKKKHFGKQLENPKDRCTNNRAGKKVFMKSL